MSLFTNFNLSEAKTSIPIIAADHKCKVRLAGVKGKSSEKGDSLSFQYDLLEPAPTGDGGRVEPGFPLFDNVTFYDKNTPQGEIPARSITKLGKIIDALLGTGDNGNKAGKPARPAIGAGVNSIEELAAAFTEALLAREMFVKVRVKTGDFEGNEVASYINPADLKA